MFASVNTIVSSCIIEPLIILQQQNQKKGSLSLALQFVAAEEPDEEQLQLQQQAQQQEQQRQEQDAQLDAVAPRQLEPGQVSPRRARSPRVRINTLTYTFDHALLW
jgi:hemolysin activation/secretion protein